MSNAIGTALHSALAGLVAGRVYPIVMADRPIYPALRYIVSGTVPANTLSGEASATMWRYRIDVYAVTAKECGQLAATVKSVMRGFAYPNTIAMEIEGYEPEVQVCRRTLDFNISDDGRLDVVPPTPTRAYSSGYSSGFA